MKKFFLIFITVIIVLLIGVVLMTFLFSSKVNITSNNAVLYNEYKDIQINQELTSYEALLIKSIFNGKRLYKENLYCGFGKNVSIEFNGLYFEIANDDCATIKFANEDKYFNITSKQKKEIEAIFIKYGGNIHVF